MESYCDGICPELQKRAAQLIPPIIGRLLKALTGKGPEIIKVSVDNHDINVKIYGFLTKGEKLLMGEVSGKDAIEKYRCKIIKADLENIRTFIRENLNLTITRVFCDFDAETDEAVIVLRYA